MTWPIRCATIGRMKEQDLQRLLKQTEAQIIGSQQQAEQAHQHHLSRFDGQTRQNMGKIKQNVARVQDYELARFGEIQSPESPSIELELERIRSELGL